MSNKITLILDRRTGDLWQDMGGVLLSCTWDVTGLERDKESAIDHVRILQNGKIIGGVWLVEEIKERWSR